MIRKISKIFMLCIMLLLFVSSVSYLVRNGGSRFCTGAANLLYDIKLSQIMNGLVFVVFFASLTITYLLIVKKSEQESLKKIFVFIAIISFIAVLILPNNSTDVFYYMGSGRLDAKYDLNPYENLFCDNQAQHMDDNIVASAPSLKTNFLYGSLWAFICRVMSSIPVNNEITMLLIFKFANFIIHILSCFMIFKMTKSKKMVLLYGLNPLILYEGLINCHNDLFMVFFIISALFFKHEKKTGLAVMSLALGALIKYVPVLLLPYIIFGDKVRIKEFEKIRIWFVQKVLKKKDTSEDIKLVPFKQVLLYVVEFISIFFGISILIMGNAKYILTFMQQTTNLMNSMYLALHMGNLPVDTVHKVLMLVFVVVYIISVLKSNKSSVYQNILLLFLIIIISNFRTWYLMWIIALIPVLEKKNIIGTLIICIGAELANFIMFFLGEAYVFGVHYFCLLMLSICVGEMVMLYLKSNSKTRKEIV